MDASYSLYPSAWTNVKIHKKYIDYNKTSKVNYN